jgi:ABC-type branched-subunit amino acid transport system substrate-binding protein
MKHFTSMSYLLGLFCIFALASSSCVQAPVRAKPSPPARPVEKAPPKVEQELHSVEAMVRSGDTKKALPRLRKLAQQNPNSDVASDSELLMGNIYFGQGQYAEALTHYELIAPGSPFEAAADLHSVQALLKLGRAAEAEPLLNRISRLSGLTGEQAQEAETLRIEVFISEKKNTQALMTMVALSEHSNQPSDREKYKQMGQELIDTKLSEEELSDVAGDSHFGSLQIAAKYRYALLLADQKQYSRARDYLASVASAAPGTDIAERANSLIQQIDTRNRVDAATIGVVLPLSGKNAATGYKALHGIQLGLGIYGKASSRLRLAVIDSEGNPDAARRAIDRLVTEDNVIAVIGGLVSKTATAEASRAQEFGVPSIMLSQKAGITQAGDSVFRNALTGQMQMHQLVEIAMGKFGMHNFAIMYPNDAYGTEYANLFWDEVKSHGGDIVGAQPYDPKETDFRGHVQRLVGTFYLEDRMSEYKERMKQWSDKNPHHSSRQTQPTLEDILPPVVDFDAVFIPDSARAIGQLAPMLAYNNINDVKLLGTNLWNSPSIVTRGQKFVENSVFVDSVLTSDPAFKASDFFTNFKNTFEEDPGLIEVQGYDSALILRQLLASGENTRVGLQRRLATLTDFQGAIGTLAVSADREIKRPMTALTIKSGQILPLDRVTQ